MNRICIELPFKGYYDAHYHDQRAKQLDDDGDFDASGVHDDALMLLLPPLPAHRINRDREKK